MPVGYTCTLSPTSSKTIVLKYFLRSSDKNHQTLYPFEIYRSYIRTSQGLAKLD